MQQNGEVKEELAKKAGSIKGSGGREQRTPDKVPMLISCFAMAIVPKLNGSCLKNISMRRLLYNPKIQSQKA